MEKGLSAFAEFEQKERDRAERLRRYEQAEALRISIYNRVTAKLEELRQTKERLRKETLELKLEMMNPPKNGVIAKGLEKTVVDMERAMRRTEEAVEKTVEEVGHMEEDLRRTRRTRTKYRHALMRAQEELNEGMDDVLETILPEDHTPEVLQLKQQVQTLLDKKRAAESEQAKLEEEMEARSLLMNNMKPPHHVDDRPRWQDDFEDVSPPPIRKLLI